MSLEAKNTVIPRNHSGEPVPTRQDGTGRPQGPVPDRVIPDSSPYRGITQKESLGGTPYPRPNSAGEAKAKGPLEFEPANLTTDFG